MHRYKRKRRRKLRHELQPREFQEPERERGAKHAIQKPLENKRQPDVDTRGPDELHDRDLAPASEHREPNRIRNNDRRSKRKQQDHRKPDTPEHIRDAQELLHGIGRELDARNHLLLADLRGNRRNLCRVDDADAQRIRQRIARQQRRVDLPPQALAHLAQPERLGDVGDAFYARIGAERRGEPPRIGRGRAVAQEDRDLDLAQHLVADRAQRVAGKQKPPEQKNRNRHRPDRGELHDEIPREIPPDLTEEELYPPPIHSAAPLQADCAGAGAGASRDGGPAR